MSSFLDPLALVFIPSGAVLIAGLLSPFYFLGKTISRRRSRSRNKKGCCARCGSGLLGPEVSGPFAYEGFFICAGCAEGLRRRYSFALPVLIAVVLIAAVSSTAGFLLGGPMAGGPGWEWWLDWRWVPLLVPSVGVGATTWIAIRRAKAANLRLTNPDGDRLTPSPPPQLDEPNVLGLYSS